MTKNKIIGIALVIIISLIGFTAFNSTSSASVVKKQLKLGNKYLNEGKYEEAILAFNKIIEIDTKNIEARIGLSDAYIGTERFEEAENILREAINIDSSRIEPYEKLIDLFKKLKKDIEQIIKLKEDALENTGDRKFQVSEMDKKRAKDKEEAESGKVAKAYYDVIYNIVNGDKRENNGIGIYALTGYEDANGAGLTYADLIDFDGDGNKELFNFYLLDGNYVYEIWGFDGKLHKIQTVKNRTGYLLRENKVISLVTVENKTYIKEKISSYGLAGFTSANTNIFYTVKNNELAEEEILTARSTLSDEDIRKYEEQGLTPPEEGTELNPIIYTITKDGIKKDISEVEYKNILKKYNGGKKIELTSFGDGGAGSADFNIDLSDNNKQLIDFIGDLKAASLKSSDIEDIYSTKTDEEKKALIEFMNIFIPNDGWFFDKFDINNFNIDDIKYFLKIYGNINGDFQNVNIELNEESGLQYWLLPVDKLNTYCQKLFGTKINLNNKNIRNGYYYLPLGEGGAMGDYNYQIVNMHSIAGDTYYVGFNRFCWGEEYNYEEGHAVIKEVVIDGEKTYQLLKYNLDK